MDTDTRPTWDLSAYLDDVRRDECYRVETVLKENPCERTELVYFTGSNGSEQGPYVRKLIDRSSGLGGIYLQLYRARLTGVRMRYLPAVYDVHDAADQTVIVMEHVPGVTLRELIEDAAPHERMEIARVVLPSLCAAAEELHTALAQTIVHRDLTPSNVVCPPHNPGALCVIDLGIARIHHDGADRDTTQYGTRPYAPPEQFGFGQTDARTDVYAIGMVAFFCLTGRDATPADREMRFSDPQVPEGVRRVIERATALDPGKRHQSAHELGRAFASAFALEDEEKTGDSGTERYARAEKDATGFSADGDAKASGEATSGRSNAAGMTMTAAADAYHRQSPLGRLLGRIPVWVGRVWNAIVLLVLLLFLVVSVGVFVAPAEGTNAAALPTWVRAYEYLCFVPAFVGLIAWALLDKRRIRPKLGARAASRTPGQRRAWWALLFAANIALLCIVDAIHGV